MNVESKPKTDPSIGELIIQLSAHTSQLVRDEMKLAQNEFREAVKHAGLGAGLLSVAGLLAILGLATFVTAAVARLAPVLPLWAAALLIGVLLFAAANIAGAVQGAIFSVVETVIDRQGARLFEKWSGEWPGS